MFLCIAIMVFALCLGKAIVALISISHHKKELRFWEQLRDNKYHKPKEYTIET